MKSLVLTANPFLANVEPDMGCMGAVRAAYTDMKVMRSNAGFYVGTECEEFDAKGVVVFAQPGTRDSGYYRTSEEAAQVLADFEAGDTSQGRFHP